MTTTITIQDDDDGSHIELKVGKRAAVPLKYITAMLDAPPGAIFQKVDGGNFFPQWVRWDFAKLEAAVDAGKKAAGPYINVDGVDHVVQR